MTEKTTEELIVEIQGKLKEKYKEISPISQVGKKCPCAGPCPLRGNCAACVAWHRDYARKPLTCCMRNQKGITFETTEDLRNIDMEV